MDSSTEESDSRTAAFSRKRKHANSLNFEHYASDSADKRLRLNNGDDEQSGRRSSKESGEVSASISSIRRDSGTVTENSEAVDLDQSRASKFGWTPVNGNANGHEGGSVASSRHDPFTNPYQPMPEHRASLDDVAIMSISRGPADEVFRRMEANQPLGMPDYQVLAQYLYSNDIGLTTHAIQHPGLKATVLGLLRTRGLDESANIAGILGAVSQWGDYSSHARNFLQERAKLVRNLPTLLSHDITALGRAREHPIIPAPTAFESGLIKLRDISQHSLKIKMERMANLPKAKRPETIEEGLRTMIVQKQPSYSQAAKFLAQFYMKHSIGGERVSILQEHAEERLSVKQLENIMINTTGFLRPLISKDIADIVPKGVLSVPVTKSMNESPDLSFAQAILLEVSRGTPSARFAKQFLETFVKINFVGGYEGTPIHSQDGLRGLTHSVSHIDGPNSIVQKLNTTGAASLTLKELESLLPKPTKNEPRYKMAKKKAKTSKYIEKFWRRPNNPTNHVVAWNLLHSIKSGLKQPSARECLNRFVHALQSGVGDEEESPGDPELDLEIDNLIEEASTHGAIPPQPQLHAQTMPLPAMNGHDARAPRPLPLKPLAIKQEETSMQEALPSNHPLQAQPMSLPGQDGHDAGKPKPEPPSTSCDYGEVARIAAAGTQVDISPLADTKPVRLCELPDTDQDLQRRYFHITDSSSLVRCLCCGKEGHMEESCPSRICAHCGALDEHFSGACPTNQHCGRCRQRGHTTAACTVLSSSLMRGLNYVCDTCGRPDHVEEECSELWRNTIGDDATIVQVPQQAMRKSCYNCGGSGLFAHWGDDCPNLSAYDRSIKCLNPTWSRKYADKFVQSTSLEKPQSGTGHESVPSYQLAMLSDM